MDNAFLSKGVTVKKGQEIVLTIDRMKYPNVGIGIFEEQEVRVKNVLKGQTLSCRISKKRSGKVEARPLEIIERAPNEQASFCEHFDKCGGCMLQTLNYENQLATKMDMVKNLFDEAGMMLNFNEIVPSPEAFEYRNKMEFSFGDEFKDGPLTLGMHKKGHHHDVIDVPFCHLIDADYRTILTGILEYAKENQLIKYNKRSNIGFLRHLVVRKSKATSEIMIALSATTQVADHEGRPFDTAAFKNHILSLPLSGKVASLLYVHNDGLGDMVTGEIECLHGNDYIIEKLFGLSFKITLYSFFQTNSQGAEILYKTALDLIPEIEGKICFDLFSGTGTIGQIMAGRAKKVIGIEWVADAVEAAKENAKMNQLDNCEFICGDVFQKLSELKDHPDVIVVDPPRSGMGDKTTRAIAAYEVPEIVYVSCNPSTLLEDLMVFKQCGYETDAITLVDMFPWTAGVETVVLLSHKKSQASSPSL